MFHDYVSLIVADYRRKKAGNTISPRLIDPTPGNLKEECTAVCHERFDKKDYNTLRTFFGQADDEKSCLKAIDNCGTDKFRPLVNFLREKTGEPEKKNIELLAWLIDFTPRPFELGRRYKEANAGPVDFERDKLKEEKNEERIDDAPGNDDNSNKDEERKGKEQILLVQSTSGETEKAIAAASLPTRPATTFKIAVTTVILAILAFAVIGYFWPATKKPQVFALTGQEACMFWTGDHFQQVSCSQKMGDTLVLALDTVKLNHFKRITKSDTITRNAIGNVWYVKVNGVIEFYTADGNHPVHPDLRLRPVTLYIINKYIRPGEQTE